MNEKTIKKLIRLVEESDIDALEVSSWGRKIRITRKLSGSSNNGSAIAAQVAPQTAASLPPAPVAQTAPVPAQTDEDKYIAIKSPMVGTFYTAPAPDAKPYVEQNHKIEKGQVVCIVEAMKLMNEIESELAGRIVKICIENAQPVEFGQTLFLVDPAG
ncbi:MAG: acetyl-CoA carboxylase biotin carboxyl carrier protein [candidate division Zixibacteria bacterium]|nr:acetyl-CoA carboxylase biotin carboxyl carrier protein [candidate division Zixibacteria bacterium]